MDANASFASPLSYPPGVVAPYTAPFILGRSAIPFIGLSSGSVAANGAISAITALPTTYASAYCWFPANALATVKAAGWYYCTFSSTVAGTAFLDAYVSGVPTIPAVPTPVTDGKGAFVGDLTEEFGPIVTVPANALGPNGVLRMTGVVAATNNANVKTLRGRYSGTGGTTVLSAALASIAGFDYDFFVQNRGVTNAQIAKARGFATGVITDSLGIYIAADTTLATSIALSIQRATATDNMVLESFCLELLYGA